MHVNAGVRGGTRPSDPLGEQVTGGYKLPGVASVLCKSSVPLSHLSCSFVCACLYTCLSVCVRHTLVRRSQRPEEGPEEGQSGLLSGAEPPYGF